MSNTGIGVLPEDAYGSIFYDYLHGSLMLVRIVSKRWNVLALQAIAMRGSLVVQGTPPDTLSEYYNGPITLINRSLFNYKNFTNMLMNDSRITGLNLSHIRLQNFGVPPCEIVKADEAFFKDVTRLLAITPTLARLKVKHFFISKNDALTLFAAVGKHPALTTLEMCGIMIKLSSMFWPEQDELSIIFTTIYKALGDALILNTNLTELNLDDTYIYDEGAAELCVALAANCSLRKLSIESTQMSTADSFCKALAVNTRLTDLNVSGNRIGCACGLPFSKALKMNTTLKKLRMQENLIKFAGVVLLCNGLEFNSTLTELDLSKNNIGEEGARVLADLFIYSLNTSLSKLTLSRKAVRDNGAEKLKKALVTIRTPLKLIYDDSDYTFYDERGVKN